MAKPPKNLSVTTPLHAEEAEAGLSKKNTFPIVALGGSAGSFTAFEKFFANMPSDSGMAFVVIMHLDPEHKSQLSEVFQRYTKMSVSEAIDGITIQANKVYIIPPNTDMGVHNGRLLMLTASKPTGRRQPIDFFFESLAKDQWNRAIAVVLSGMGADGETGIRMVKENLGLTIVQDPESAEFNSMPVAAIGTNQADYVLSPEEMPLKIIQYFSHPVFAEQDGEDTQIVVKNNNDIQKILMLLRTHTGNDFTLYNKSTITRRIDRRLAFHQFFDYAQYVKYLIENPEELDILCNELLIGVTKFFRDFSAFDSLRLSLEELIAHKIDDEPIRVWVAGCSTGEEAYSIAMILIETVETAKNKVRQKIQIYATDLDT